MKAILSTLATIAASLGINELASYITGQIASKEGVSLKALSDIVNTLYNSAANISSNKLDEINDKLSNINTPYNVSSIIKNKYQEARNKLVKRQQKLNNSINKINTNISNVERSINSLGSTSDSYRLSSAGKKEKDDIVAATKDITADISKLEKSILGE